MTPAIIGLATAAPVGSIAQEDALAAARAFSAAALNGEDRLLPILYRKTAIARRGSVLLRADGTAETFFAPATDAADRGPTTAERMARYRDSARELAERAAAAALCDAAIPARQITHLVTASCTGFEAPGVDWHLVQALGLPRTVQRTHIGYMGCHGAINALRVAAAFAADPEAVVLICCVEVCTLHYQYGADPDKLVANAIFADGAAAAVIRASPGGAAEVPGRLWIASTGSCIFPDSADAMTWSIGNHGFEMTLSSRVPELLRAHLRPWVSEWLGGQGLALGDVGSWAVHPGGPRVISTVAECLGLSLGQTAASRAILSEHGNMSSPTVLFILERLVREGAPRPCAALAFGPGLVAEGALLA